MSQEKDNNFDLFNLIEEQENENKPKKRGRPSKKNKPITYKEISKIIKRISTIDFRKIFKDIEIILNKIHNKNNLTISKNSEIHCSKITITLNKPIDNTTKIIHERLNFIDRIIYLPSIQFLNNGIVLKETNNNWNNRLYIPNSNIISISFNKIQDYSDIKNILRETQRL